MTVRLYQVLKVKVIGRVRVRVKVGVRVSSTGRARRLKKSEGSASTKYFVLNQRG